MPLEILEEVPIQKVTHVGWFHATFMRLINMGCFFYWGFLRFEGHDFRFWGHVFLVVLPCGAIPLSIGHDLCHFPFLVLTFKELELGSKLGPSIGTLLDFLNSTQDRK
jgi:hypothetical protein